MQPFSLAVDEDVTARLPELRVTAFVFSGVRMGMPTRNIEPMRDRVIAGARERMSSIRDPRRIPAIAAFYGAFPEVGRTKRIWLEDALRAIARHDPFPVVNDVVDSARLLSLLYEAPMCVLDLGRLKSPFRLVIAPHGVTSQTPPGVLADLSGLPVLIDPAGAAASPVVELARAQPSRQARDVALFVFDPRREGATDLADLETRASNWLGTLTGAKLAGKTTAP
jgi:DNA/RNA-binding domain of Phe-tRNA-synthetase-like protein